MQCCGSGMIYSGSGPSYEFLEFRILLMIFKHIWKLFLIKPYKINQKEESTNYLQFSISDYSTKIQNSQTGSGTNNSGSRKKFRIHNNTDYMYCIMVVFIIFVI